MKKNHNKVTLRCFDEQSYRRDRLPGTPANMFMSQYVPYFSQYLWGEYQSQIRF